MNNWFLSRFNIQCSRAPVKFLFETRQFPYNISSISINIFIPVRDKKLKSILTKFRKTL